MRSSCRGSLSGLTFSQWAALMGRARSRCSVSLPDRHRGGFRAVPPKPPTMIRGRSQVPLVDQLPELMQERGLSTNRLARTVGVSQSHLSRALRGADRKTVGGELAARIAVALKLPEDWFPETRETRLFDRLRRDAALRDRLYDEFVGSSPL
jgi:transcriptional regulator with XRE-family HTH domain